MGGIEPGCMSVGSVVRCNPQTHVSLQLWQQATTCDYIADRACRCCISSGKCLSDCLQLRAGCNIGYDALIHQAFMSCPSLLSVRTCLQCPWVKQQRVPDDGDVLILCGHPFMFLCHGVHECPCAHAAAQLVDSGTNAPGGHGKPSIVGMFSCSHCSISCLAR